MEQTVTTIDMGGVNCYLVKTTGGYVLVDSGFANRREALVKALADAGCQAGDLQLIVLTHGDHDHAGNAAYLRRAFGAKIAMHDGDSGMVELGDQRWNRKARSDRLSFIGRLIIGLGGLMAALDRANPFERFTPDFYVADGHDFTAFGFAARVLHLPGHSQGSIGILTAEGDLFCGDLFWNMRKPSEHFLVDDAPVYAASVDKVKRAPIQTIYPGHGKPFTAGQL